MNIGKALELTIEDARKNNILKKGFRQISQAVCQGKATLVIKTEDTDLAIQKVISAMCAEFEVPLFTISDRHTLAIWAGQTEVWGKDAVFYQTMEEAYQGRFIKFNNKNQPKMADLGRQPRSDRRDLDADSEGEYFPTDRESLLNSTRCCAVAVCAGDVEVKLEAAKFVEDYFNTFFDSSKAS